MIFYFSATGNSRWTATELKNKTGEQLVNISDAIKDTCSYSLKENEIIGFVFPVHGWRIPRILTEFLERLKVETIDNEAHYSFCLLTTGDSIGRTMERFRSLFQKINTSCELRLSAVASIIMPESYVGLPGMDVDTQEKEKLKIETAKEQINEFAAIINERKPVDKNGPLGWNELTRGPVPDFFSGPVGAFFQKFLITDKPFRVVDEKCVRCGICAEVCPVNDIKGGLGHKPVWLHNDKCLTCFACYHHCPHHAIQYGNRTRAKGQYFFGRRKLYKNK